MTDLQKNAKEVVRVERTEYNGKTYVSARIWYDDDGALMPSKKGLTLPPDLARAVAEAILREVEQ